MRIRGSVVVVTGASSGIGRATALALAARQARLVLVARDTDSLAQAAAECATAGAETLVVAADVANPEAVELVAHRAVERYGRIDAWVNAASVMMFGSLLDVPLEDVRRVLDVNLMGCVHGCRSALPRMIAQDRGVIVNVSSLLGVVALPLGSAYTMSKFAIRGLGGSLRQELRLSGHRGVTVCTVLPGPIDTPIFANAANHSRRQARALPPLYTPERVARTIVNQVRFPRREVVAGGLLGRAFLLLHKVLPGTAERVMAVEINLFGLSPTETAPASTGNLYQPAPGPGRVHGDGNGRLRERRRRAGTITLAVVAAGVLRHRRSA